MGLGWLLSHHGYAVHAGAGGGVTVSLLVHRRDGRVLVSMTNRVTPLTSVEAPLLRAWQS